MSFFTLNMGIIVLFFLLSICIFFTWYHKQKNLMIFSFWVTKIWFFLHRCLDSIVSSQLRRRTVDVTSAISYLLHYWHLQRHRLSMFSANVYTHVGVI